MAAEEVDAKAGQSETAEAEEVEVVEGEAVDEEPAAEAADAEGEEPEAVEADADAEAGDADGDEGEGGPDIFTAIKQEVTDLRDKYARLQAEWDNYRKRTAAERASERVRASEGLVEDLLPVLDDLERAIKHAQDTGEGGSLTEGVAAIQGKFLQILGKHKVEQLEAQGKPFDAMQHQAVGTQEDDSVPEETVIQVYQQGYKMGDRVLRPAMVVTSTGGPAREPAPDDEGTDEE